jgi:hypothetical protein
MFKYDQLQLAIDVRCLLGHLYSTLDSEIQSAMSPRSQRALELALTTVCWILQVLSSI